MFTYETYAIEGGFGVRVLRDGQATITQDWDPDLPGFSPMTQERADTLGQILVARLGG